MFERTCITARLSKSMHRCCHVPVPYPYSPLLLRAGLLCVLQACCCAWTAACASSIVPGRCTSCTCTCTMLSKQTTTWPCQVIIMLNSSVKLVALTAVDSHKCIDPRFYL